MRFRALRDFFTDLFSGDPVAIALLLGFLTFVALLCLGWFWVHRKRKREDEEFKRKLYKLKPKKPTP